LRTKALASMTDNEVVTLLPSLAMPADSFFPVLLMAHLRTQRLQSALWKRLSEINLGVYLDALRYRLERMVRMPPKLHKNMKLGKSKAKASAKASPPKKRG
jgi:hypothetical protein